MQKHHKYMVWTIWVAAIGFIGAGSVGWGSLHFGSKASTIAKVGDIGITQQDLNQAYSQLYAKYAQLFKGNFDEKKAKELGLAKQAFTIVETQAKLLNFAKENGIIVTDKEVFDTISQMKAFWNQGKFDKKVYKTLLKNKKIKAKDFESNLKKDLVIQKTINLLSVKPLKLELETIASSMNIADKIEYKILTTQDINVSIDNDKLLKYWEANKKNYKTATTYELAIIWKKPKDINISNDELKSYYDTYSFKFTDRNGKLLSFEEAKANIKTQLKLQATKKSAQLDYIAFKKGKINQTETVTLSLGDNTLTPSVWQTIKDKNIGDILKPKIINNKYAIIKIVSIKHPKVKTFEKAKSQVSKDYLSKIKQEALQTKAENIIKKLQNYNPIITDFVKLDTINNIKGLNSQESLHFLQNLFTSNKQKGIIYLSEQKVVVYNIIEQKFDNIDSNITKNINPIVNKLKSDVFQSNLIEQLNAKYQTEVYVKGLLK
jgi:peptidyl-prolyl cis-trans isomerase D